MKLRLSRKSDDNFVDDIVRGGGTIKVITVLVDITVVIVNKGGKLWV